MPHLCERWVMGVENEVMKQCPFCAEDIRAAAVKCKHCGSDLISREAAPAMRPVVAKSSPSPAAHPPPQGSFMRTIRNASAILAFLILATVVGTCVVCGKAAHDVSEKNKTAERDVRTSDTPLDVSARDLEAAYTANEVAADKQFRGKVLRVSGTVDRISKDILDDPHVILRSGQPLGGVTCSFGSGADAAIAKLAKGQSVVLRGMGAGSFMGGPMLKACVIDSGAPATGVQQAMAKMREFRDMMCACKDQGCANGVQDAMNRWSAENAKNRETRPPAPSEAEMEQMQLVGTQYGECMARVWQDPGSAPTPARKTTRPTPARSKLSLPAECRQYQAAISALAKCDKLPQATRDALKQSYEQTAAAWATVPEEGMEALATACKSAADAVEESVAACR